MGTRKCIAHCNVTDSVDRLGVVQGAITVQDTTMSVGCVFAEADVGNNK